MLNIAVFVSGGGTNLQALIDAQDRGEIKTEKLLLSLLQTKTHMLLSVQKKQVLKARLSTEKHMIQRRIMTKLYSKLLRAEIST